jgi:hypothetical protein
VHIWGPVSVIIDKLERMRATYANLPFTDTDEQGIPTTHTEKAKH